MKYSTEVLLEIQWTSLNPTPLHTASRFNQPLWPGPDFYEGRKHLGYYSQQLITATLAWSRGGWFKRSLLYRINLGMAILSVTPKNMLLWTFLMENFNLGIAKMPIILENLVLPKTSAPYSEISSLTPPLQRHQ